MIRAFAASLRELLAASEPAVLVSVVTAKGSTPREAGARMVVTTSDIDGTVGGGRLERDAIERARGLLGSDETSAVMDVPLGPELGQCCGGFVSLRLERVDDAVCTDLETVEHREREQQPLVLLFGAGHVGKALAATLAPLPLRVRWIDGRADEFPSPSIAGPEIVVTERPLAEIAAAPAGASFLVLTHSHSLDFSLCEAVLQRGDFAYLGLIGSRTKRRRFERGWRQLGITDARITRLICPIGGNRLRDKRPAVIAALVASELLHHLADGAATGNGDCETGEAA